MDDHITHILSIKMCQTRLILTNSLHLSFVQELNLNITMQQNSSTGFKTSKVTRLGPEQTRVRKGSVGRVSVSSTMKQSALKAGLADLDNISLSSSNITVDKLKKFKLKPGTSEKESADVSKDPALAVRQMLANRQNIVNTQKVSLQGSDHKPIIIKQSQISSGTGSSAAAVDLDQKTAMLEKIKRIGAQGGQSAPMKVKLKTNQIAFKSSEIKMVTGDSGVKRPSSKSRRPPS